ncbi:IS66 family insertion sequence element accessory protein TnpA [Aquimarina aggregata]|uniref:IS66 family insertion sequence element accessory protein TnpA n=1 Tax=Aquimarina aggregata TaxID=1642818 RepID=UPI002491BA71|nr:hypothetical protein [Aquimarina aggregata]
MSKKDIASQMRKLVKQFKNSVQSQKEFAATHGLKEGKLYYWVSKLSKPQQSVTPLTPSKKDFVAIEVRSEEEDLPRKINELPRCMHTR